MQGTRGRVIADTPAGSAGISRHQENTTPIPPTNHHINRRLMAYNDDEDDDHNDDHNDADDHQHITTEGELDREDMDDFDVDDGSEARIHVRQTAKDSRTAIASAVHSIEEPSDDDDPVVELSDDISVTLGGKRKRGADAAAVKATSKRTKAKPKAADYNNATAVLLLIGQAHCRCLTVSTKPFAPALERVTMADDAFDAAIAGTDTVAVPEDDTKHNLIVR